MAATLRVTTMTSAEMMAATTTLLSHAVVVKLAVFVVSQQPHTLRAFALGGRMGLSEQPSRAAATWFTPFVCGQKSFP